MEFCLWEDGRNLVLPIPLLSNTLEYYISNKQKKILSPKRQTEKGRPTRNLRLQGRIVGEVPELSAYLYIPDLEQKPQWALTDKAQTKACSF